MLHITTTSHLYSCQPKTKRELREIIGDRIEEDGPECDLNDIDVSKIDDMSHLFNANAKYARQYGNDIFKDFNGDISRWNVSNVEDMHDMFYECKKFNCDISRWDVSKVTDMHEMFTWCKQFNCDLSKWNVSKVTDIASMFYFCRSFNQDIDDWNVSNVENMKHAFFECPTQPEWYYDEDSNKFKQVYYPIISPL